MNHYLRIFPPGHPFGNPKLWCWEVCSMNDVAVSGTSDDMQDCMDVASSALLGVMEEEIRFDGVDMMPTEDGNA